MRSFPILTALLLAAVLGAAPSRGDAMEEAFPAADQSDFVIGPNDELEVKVWGLDDMNQINRVTPRGTFRMPLLGELELAGMSLREAEAFVAGKLIEAGLLRENQRDRVTIHIREYVSRRVSVDGAVNRAGHIELVGHKTLLSVLSEAGGLNDRAGKTAIVYRTGADGKTSTMIVDLEELYYGGRADLDLELQPGDRIIVPFVKQVRVFVEGAVGRPGPVQYPKDETMTLLKAIVSAGGTTDRANESRVQIHRRTPDGQTKTFTVNLKRIKRGKDPDPVLMENDIITVRETFF